AWPYSGSLFASQTSARSGSPSTAAPVASARRAPVISPVARAGARARPTGGGAGGAPGTVERSRVLSATAPGRRAGEGRRRPAHGPPRRRQVDAGPDQVRGQRQADLVLDARLDQRVAREARWAGVRRIV